MNVDPVARGLAIAGLVVAVGGTALNYYMWHRSGGRLRVRIRLRKHAYDPGLHRVELEVTNVGRLGIRVTAMGVRDMVTTAGTSSTSSSARYITLPVEPTDGGALPRLLQHMESVVAELPMAAVVARWFPDGKVSLKAWAQAGGKRRESFRSLLVRTPPIGPDAGN